MGVLSFLAVLRARFMLIVWTFALCTIVAAAIGAAIPPRYQAQTVLQVDAAVENLLTGAQEPRQRTQEFLGQQGAVAASRSAALLAVNDLIATGDLSLSAWEADWVRQTKGDLQPGNDLKTWIADQLLEHMSVSADGLESTLTISYVGQRPEQAARYANAFADAYIVLVTDYRKRASFQNAKNFDNEIITYQTHVEKARETLAQFQQNTGYVTIGTQQLEAAEVELGSLTARLAEARGDDAEAQSLWELTRNTSRDQLNALPLPTNNVPGRSAQGRLSTLVAQMEKIEERYGPAHPDYIELKNEMRRLEDIIYASVRERATYTLSRIEYLNTEVTAQKQRVLDLQEKKQRFDVLEKDLSAAQQTYDLIASRSQQEGLQARIESVSVFVLAQAVPSAHESLPNFWVILAAGMLLGIGMGMTMAVFVELLEARLRHPQSVINTTRKPVLAEITLNLPQRRRMLA